MLWDLRQIRFFACCDGDECTLRNARELQRAIDDWCEKYKRLLEGRHQRSRL
jgi:hypothetical protein